MSSQAAARRRVVALLNAISDLHEGDLHAVLGLHALYDHEIYGDLVEFRGDLGRLLEEHLATVMGYGEAALDHDQKRTRAKKALGGMHWS
jgi:hypothetical protein